MSDYDSYDYVVGNKNNTKLWNLTYQYLLMDDWETYHIIIAFTSKTILDADSIQFFYYEDVSIEYQYDSKFWDWKYFDKDIMVEEYDWQGFNKWYSTNATTQENKLYRVRVWIDILFDGLAGTSGKYIWAIKEHDKTMQEAIDDGRLLYLDPWWDSRVHTYVCDDTDAQGYRGATNTDGGFDDGGEIEFSAAFYTAISVDDNNRVTHQANSGEGYPYTRFNFTIAEDVDNIIQIDITWKGFGIDNQFPSNCGASLWVKDTGSWSEKDNHGGCSKATLTAQQTSSFSDWIVGGVLECGAQADEKAVTKQVNIYSYYVEVKITYSITPSIHIGGGSGDGTTSIHILGGYIGGN